MFERLMLVVGTSGVLLAGCGDTQEESTGAAGSSGSAGQSGASGASGASGSSGQGGSAGSAGSAGSSGQGGSAGTAGSSGQGGQAGSAGTAGSSGQGGSAGASGQGGSAGASGQGGSAGSGGNAGPCDAGEKPTAGAFPPVVCYVPGKDGAPTGPCQAKDAKLVTELAEKACPGSGGALDGPFCSDKAMPSECCYTANCPTAGRPLYVHDDIRKSEVLATTEWTMNS